MAFTLPNAENVDVNEDLNVVPVGQNVTVTITKVDEDADAGSSGMWKFGGKVTDHSDETMIGEYVNWSLFNVQPAGTKRSDGGVVSEKQEAMGTQQWLRLIAACGLELPPPADFTPAELQGEEFICEVKKDKKGYTRVDPNWGG